VLAHDVAWWKSVLAGGEAALASLPGIDRLRVRAHSLLRTMLGMLRPEEDVALRPAGPFYDGHGNPQTASDMVEALQLEEIASVQWAPAE
jgi:hypothetical protein